MGCVRSLSGPDDVKVVHLCIPIRTPVAGVRTGAGTACFERGNHVTANTRSGNSTLPLGPGHKEDITNLLILRFQKLMREGVLTPGSLLPSERELAVTFGVARSSLRQAMKVLETMGVVTQKVGDGTYLSKDGTYVLSVPMQFLFLLDDISP